MRLMTAACCALTALPIGAGCKGFEGMKRMLTEIVELSTGISKEFGEQRVYIDIANTTLTVTFGNSKLADLPEGERAETARSVATYVRDHYPGYDSLSHVNVAFMTQSGFAGTTVTKASVPYHFTTSDLGPGPASTRPARDGAGAKVKSN